MAEAEPSLEQRVKHLEDAYTQLAQNFATLMNAMQAGVATRSLAIVDEDHEPVLALQATEDGGAVALKNQHGDTVLFLTADEHGGQVVVNNAAGIPAVVLRVEDTGSGRVIVFDPEGEQSKAVGF